jgi:hypothetical protein
MTYQGKGCGGQGAGHVQSPFRVRVHQLSPSKYRTGTVARIICSIAELSLTLFLSHHLARADLATSEMKKLTRFFLGSALLIADKISDSFGIFIVYDYTHNIMHVNR